MVRDVGDVLAHVCIDRLLEEEIDPALGSGGLGRPGRLLPRFDGHRRAVRYGLWSGTTSMGCSVSHLLKASRWARMTGWHRGGYRGSATTVLDVEVGIGGKVTKRRWSGFL